jgi:membrane protease YdiL (CAAX protease family)
LTGPSQDPDDDDGSDRRLDDPPAPAPPPGDPALPRPGLSTFTIEGRAAPGLFVVGWIATVLGVGAVVAAILAGNAPAVLVVGLVLLSIGLVAGAGSQAIERRARGAAFPGPSPLLVFAATIPVSYLVAIAVGAVLEGIGADAPRAAADLLIVAIQALVTIGLVALLVAGAGGVSWREMGWHGGAARVGGELAWGAVFAGPVIAVTIVVTGILVAIFGVTPDSPLPPTGEMAGLILHLIAGAVIAPLSEEILFRGVATTAWVRAYGLTSGIVRGAIFFALAHVLLLGGRTVAEALAIAFVAFAGRLPVALVLGWVYARRGSLWAPIGLHAAFNGILLVLADFAVRSGAAPA